jgi:hypothetical protein
MAIFVPGEELHDAQHEALGNPADPILFWNAVAIEANRISHTNGAGEQTGPTLSSRAMGIVHLAMYDAYTMVINDPAGPPTYLPNLPDPQVPAGANFDVEAASAVAGAAYKTLVTLFPSQKAFFDLALNGTGKPSPDRVAYGKEVAKLILADRHDDPGAEALGYKAVPVRYHHRLDPDNSQQGFHAPYYGAKSKGFAISVRHEIDAPPQDNAEYEAALFEVRGRGIAPHLMGTLPSQFTPRTSNETVRGIYWGYDGAAKLGTPPRLYNQIVRRIAIARQNTVTQNARLFALVNVAMADAGILSWDQKYIHDFWRPVVGIREHDQSMGPDADTPNDTLSSDCDTGWLPLGGPSTNSTGKNFTPPFPAYPSGHATFGAAALHMTRLFYGVVKGDRGPDSVFTDLAGKHLDFVSDEFNGVNQDNHGTVRPRHVRNFPAGLWQMIIENGLSRVDIGVHWVFDAFAVTENENGEQVPDLTRNVGGVPLGITIAEDIFMNNMTKSTVGPRPNAPDGGSWQTPVQYIPTEVQHVRR